MKKLIFILLLVQFISGCATVNFSSKYYTLPNNYEQDIQEVWNEIMTNVPLKHKDYYSYRIVKDNETNPAGMPQSISEGNNRIILLPEYFIKYVWEFYYPKYNKNIIACLFIHELGHPESGYSSNTPQQHILCYNYSLENLMLPWTDPDAYYSTLVIARDYYSARKGAGGHLFNIGWNAANIFSAFLGGPSMIGDLYATDIDYRLLALKNQYKNPPIKFCFNRNR